MKFSTYLYLPIHKRQKKNNEVKLLEHFGCHKCIRGIGKIIIHFLSGTEKKI